SDRDPSHNSCCARRQRGGSDPECQEVSSGYLVAGVLFGLRFLLSLLILFLDNFGLTSLGSTLHGFSKSPRNLTHILPGDSWRGILAERDAKKESVAKSNLYDVLGSCPSY